MNTSLLRTGIWVLGVIVFICGMIYFTSDAQRMGRESDETNGDMYAYQNGNQNTTGTTQNTTNDQTGTQDIAAAPTDSVTTKNPDTTTSNNTNSNNSNQTQKPMDVTNKIITLKTNKGEIKIQLNSTAPVAASNFYDLSAKGFYNGVRFHRVIDGFMIQGGDPQSKDTSLKARWGTGGPGYAFPDELSGNEKYTVGTVAMANSGPNTNGSQFFIMVADVPLPPSYTVFGKVISGLDVALSIGKVATDPTSDRPLEDVIINSVEVTE